MINSLLEKDPEKRLGSVPMGGILSIKKHPFFEEVNWDDVLAKNTKPPIKIKVKKTEDTKHMDTKYLKEAIKNTPEREGGVNMALLNKMHFDNFTFNGDEESERNGRTGGTGGLESADDIYDKA